MLSVLDALGLTELVTTIPGLSAVGAATILAETGDPTRFSSARALVKHAGLCPRDNASGTYQGKTAISGRGRPEHLAAWRAVFGALRHNPVHARQTDRHLTGRADSPLTDTQARIAVAATLPPAARRDRDPHRLERRRRRRPRPARGRSRHRRLSTRAADHGRGELRMAVGTPIPQLTMSSPARLPPSPDEGCREQPA